MTSSDAWHWKVAEREQNPDLGLRYEPGNWGDVLKGLWALALRDVIAEQRAIRSLQVLDPWAGAPTWPLRPEAAERLAVPEAATLRQAQAAAGAEGRLASTAGLLLGHAARVSQAARAAQSVRGAVFDLDPSRRAAWAELPHVTVLDLTDGADALERSDSWPTSAAEAPRLLLVDPYDLFERFEQLLPAALHARHDAAVLFYLFNKAPRGAAAHRRYLGLRDMLQRGLVDSGRVCLVGRLPSDAVLPRAWHEVLAVVPADWREELAARVEAPTRQLAAGLAAAGACEG